MTRAGDLGFVHDAALAAAIFALDPAQAVGVRLRAPPGPLRESWLELLAELMVPGAPMRRIPLNVSASRLLGGLDVAATLESARPVIQRGLLAEADGGAVVLSMAERVAPELAAVLGAALDSGLVMLERDGLTLRHATRFGVIALDEGLSREEQPPDGLLDRLSMHLELDGLSLSDMLGWSIDADTVRRAGPLVAQIGPSEDALTSLGASAMSLGIPSLRAPLAAFRVARAAAALAGRARIEEEDLKVAARLVLAPRARMLPTGNREEDAKASKGEPEPERTPSDDRDAGSRGDERLRERVLEAARSALPPGLLAALTLNGGRLKRRGPAGKSGTHHRSGRRGRPAGVCRGDPRAGYRLNVVETLRVAAPWQRVRGRALTGPADVTGSPRIRVQREDFRVTRYRPRAETTVVFTVDASGSSALHRLAEAKGAVEILLSETYARRDRVALIAFRGARAELLLPPTRSLVRARRCLAGLPGGGGTPLASGLDAAHALSERVLKSGGTAVVVVLTDGRANVTRQGIGGRQRACEEARDAARRLAVAGAFSLLIDTSPRPQAAAMDLAARMAARYLPLPHAGSAVISEAVRGARFERDRSRATA